MRFLSSSVAGGSLAAAAAAEFFLAAEEALAFFSERFVGAVEMTVIIENVAREGHTVMEEEVASGKGDVSPAVLQAVHDTAFVGPP